MLPATWQKKTICRRKKPMQPILVRVGRSREDTNLSTAAYRVIALTAWVASDT